MVSKTIRGLRGDFVRKQGLHGGFVRNELAQTTDGPSGIYDKIPIKLFGSTITYGPPAHTIPIILLLPTSFRVEMHRVDSVECRGAVEIRKYVNHRFPWVQLLYYNEVRKRQL